MVYGHIFAGLWLLVTDKAWVRVALPLLARIDVRRKDLVGILPGLRPTFWTKQELAVELLRWAEQYLGLQGKPIRVVTDGADARITFLQLAKSSGMSISLFRFEKKLVHEVERSGRRVTPEISLASPAFMN